MGRKRLIGLIAGVALVVPLPGVALEDSVAAATGDDVTVVVPGVGSVSAAAQADPEASSVEASVVVVVPEADVTVAPEVSVSATDGVDVVAAAPVVVGPVAAEPVADVLAPALEPVADVVDPVAPGVVPDVTTTQQPPAGAAEGPAGAAPVKAAAAPRAGDLEHDVTAASAPNAAQRPRAVEEKVAAPAAASEAPAEAAIVAGPRWSVTPHALPALPEGAPAPWALRILATAMVVAAGLSNAVAARRLG